MPQRMMFEKTGMRNQEKLSSKNPNAKRSIPTVESTHIGRNNKDQRQRKRQVLGGQEDVIECIRHLERRAQSAAAVATTGELSMTGILDNAASNMVEKRSQPKDRTSSPSHTGRLKYYRYDAIKIAIIDILHECI
jgi:hypothetical protein